MQKMENNLHEYALLRDIRSFPEWIMSASDFLGWIPLQSHCFCKQYLDRNDVSS